VRTGRTSQTIEIYEKALERKPNQPRIHHFLGVLYEYGGKPDLAVTHYEEAIKLSPDLAESKNNLAYLYAESGKNLDRALDLAQDAKALMPDDPQHGGHAGLGAVPARRALRGDRLPQGGRGRREGRGRHARLIRHHLAQAYEASGDKENAKTTLDARSPRTRRSSRRRRPAGSGRRRSAVVRDAARCAKRLA
jgi:tetratricopeptide (TPR) repeat protein